MGIRNPSSEGVRPCSQGRVGGALGADRDGPLRVGAADEDHSFEEPQEQIRPQIEVTLGERAPPPPSRPATAVRRPWVRPVRQGSRRSTRRGPRPGSGAAEDRTCHRTAARCPRGTDPTAWSTDVAPSPDTGDTVTRVRTACARIHTGARPPQRLFRLGKCRRRGAGPGRTGRRRRRTRFAVRAERARRRAGQHHVRRLGRARSRSRPTASAPHPTSPHPTDE